MKAASYPKPQSQFWLVRTRQVADVHSFVQLRMPGTGAIGPQLGAMVGSA